MLNLLMAAVALVALAGPPPVKVCAGLGIAGDVKVPVHRMVILRASGGPEGAGYDWEVSPDDKAHVIERGEELTFTGPPGKYKVTLRAITSVGGKTTVVKCRVEVLVEDDAPPVPMPAPKGPDAPKPKADPVAATAQIIFGDAKCTATVMWPRREDGRWDVLTAAHCVRGQPKKGKMRLRDGRTFKVTVQRVSNDVDVCWLTTDEKVESMPFAFLAAENPSIGVFIWHNGYGIDKPSNVEHGVVTGGEDKDGQLAFRLSVSSGDSGGGIFRWDTGEVVSCVCCTKTKGALAPVWGGSCVQAGKLRPK